MRAQRSRCLSASLKLRDSAVSVVVDVRVRVTESGDELSPVRVLTVDDHAPFRDAARDVIAATSGFQLVGEATCGPEALLVVERLAPELILLDVQMPGMDGVEVAKRVLALYPETLVVLVSAIDPRRLPAAARLAGMVALERKQDLCPQRLRALWADRRRPPTSSGSDDGAGPMRP
jgi:DNA-binding NarL/FixJ family response regulator